ncbi:hypothetical protein DFS34DRAFT_464154 [Phlyctochytrium arcticum]|nr:hypothetical protein DFS34DRAFT_464154 [Phlyctochytrium arcticum]
MQRDYSSMPASVVTPPAAISDQPSHAGLGFTPSNRNWYDVPCSELLARCKQEVVVISGDAPVEQACETLITNGISSAPVWDKDKQIYVGMFDYRDVVSFVLIGLRKDMVIDDTSPSQLREVVKRARAHQPVPAKLAVDLSHKNPFLSVMAETRILQIAELFSRGIHRVAVMNDELQGIISQSTVIQYLYANVSWPTSLFPSSSHRKLIYEKKNPTQLKQFPEIQTLFSKTLTELGLGSKSVISISSSTSVMEALKLMSKNDVSSLAILSDQPDGGILANLSMSDIKWVMRSFRFNLLWETVLHFVGFVDSEQGVRDGKDKVPVFDVLESSTLGFAVGKMVATRAHRVWVVERTAGPPVSVVTLTDVFRVITPGGGQQ